MSTAVAGPHATTSQPARPWPRAPVLGYLALALLSYVPLLFDAAGRVVVDTKEALYLDPGRLLARAPYVWSPSTAFGTVTHQDIGYLFPAGPFYWVFHTLHLPVWVTQRLWLGSIIFAAGLGVLFLLRTLAIRGPGVVVAALTYMLSPYLLQYASRISILLLAWSALPWLIGITARALREGGWRYPALFAVVAQVAGSVNATALILVLIGPALWVVHSVVVSREVSVGHAVRTMVRVGVLTMLLSLWWIAGLAVEAAYGLNVLNFTESIKVVSVTGHSGEVTRGIGYWLFYGGDRLGPWIQASVDYSQRRWLIATGYAIPVLAMVSAAFIRWRHRVFFVALIVVGLAIAVGTHPYDDPSPFGSAVKAFGEGSTVGLALRSVGRAVPLVVLGIAVLLGCGANALARWLAERGRARVGLGACGVLCVLAAVNLPSLWTGSIYGANVQRPEDVPRYWSDAIAALDAKPHDTRILELPGADFAQYRWGDTVVSIVPGLTDRPAAARELIPYGSAASANLLDAFDRRLQMGLLDARAIAPVARLMSVGDVVLRNDLQVDRYNLARPREIWSLFRPTPTGLKSPEAFGQGLGPPLTLSQLDARTLGLPANVKDPPPVAVYGVRDPRPIVRAEPTGSELIVSGDGDGLVDLAGVGLLSAQDVVRYSGSFAGHTEALDAALRQGAVLVVTDSNRKRAQRWDNVRDNTGYTERAHEQPLARDNADSRLEVFPDAGVDGFTVMDQRHVRVSASGYGSTTAYLPSNRPARAVDGDPSTAWRVGEHGAVLGQRIRLDFAQPVTTGHIDLLQPLNGARDRYITRVRLRFADRKGRVVGKDAAFTLGPKSRTVGQAVRFLRRRFSRLEVVIDGDNVGVHPNYPTDSAVGFAEIRVADDGIKAAPRRVDEVVRMPTDLVGNVRGRAAQNALLYEMTRLRTVISSPVVDEEERSLVRSFLVPSAREFGVSGTARASRVAPGDRVDRVLGLSDAQQGGVTVRASQHLPTTPLARASSALDGDPGTSWSTDVGDPTGQWIEVQLSQPHAFDHLDLQLVVDGRHSVPTRLRIEAGGAVRHVDVPRPTANHSGAGAVVSVPVSFPSLTGDRLRVTIERTAPATTVDADSERTVTLPVAIAELGIPDVRRATPPVALPEGCRDDLLHVDGVPVPVRLKGTPADLLTGTAQLEACAPLHLSRGTHVLRATPGTRTGLDVDGVVLASMPGGAAASSPAALTTTAGRRHTPRLDHVKLGTARVSARVRDARGPFWLVLGESFNDGWHAKVDGHDLGPPHLVDGLSNGWRVDPHGRRELTIALTWTPQRAVWIAIIISAVTLLACALLVFMARRRREPTAQPRSDDIELSMPASPAGSDPSRRATITTTLAITAASVLLIAPWAGIVVGVVALVVLLRPNARWLLTLGAPGALAATGIYVVVQQWRHGYPAVLEWPTYFDSVHVLGWISVALLAADAVIEVVRARASTPRARSDASHRGTSAGTAASG